MFKKSFSHGVHPHGGKQLSAHAPIRRIEVPGEYVYPLSQHIGAPAVPVVAVGDRVLAGQLIADGGAFVSAPIYSAVSGTVRAIEPRHVTSGDEVRSIVIESEEKTEWIDPAYAPEKNPPATEGEVKDRLSLSHVADMDAAAIRAAVRKAGIVGLGGAGFPAAVKLTPPEDDAIDYLIINGAECEPYLTSDYRLMLERGTELLAGCTLLLRLFPNARCVIGIEDNKPAAIEALKRQAMAFEKITVCPLKTKYPQGGERMLISAITGRKLNSKMLPSGVGCIVMNVASVIASYHAITAGRPLTHRIMTITGEGVTAPCNVEVPIGASQRAVVDAVGGLTGAPEKIISGGPMMGTSIYTLDIPVTKTSASVLALQKDPVALHDTSACIRCGKCLAACPEHLVPVKLVEAAEHDDFASFERLGGMECIECGSCAYICPAKRHLVQSLRYGKRETGAIIRARDVKR